MLSLGKFPPAPVGTGHLTPGPAFRTSLNEGSEALETADPKNGGSPGPPICFQLVPAQCYAAALAFTVSTEATVFRICEAIW